MPGVVDWEALITAAWRVRANAHAPYSRFAVGAALQSLDGAIHAGCNVENIAFPSGQCAEASAIGNMVSTTGAVSIVAVVVATEALTFTWPCGQCRQKLVELAAPDCIVVSVTADARSAPRALANLLPGALTSLT